MQLYIPTIHSNYANTAISPLMDVESLSSDGPPESRLYIPERSRGLQDGFYYFPRHCFARTTFPVQRKSVSWPVNKIPNVNYKNQFIYVVTSDEIPTILITLYLNDDNTNAKKICVDINASEYGQEKFFSICRISIIDTSGKVQYLAEDENYITYNKWHIAIPCSGTSLTNENPPFEKLMTLQCEMAISNGRMRSAIESVSYENVLSDNEVEMSECPSTLNYELSDLYKTNRFCDIQLHLKGRSFQAHKVILCARSPVFNAMFKNDTMENQTNEINIEDVDADTMKHLLYFMYSDSLENLPLDAYCKLYEAADKYHVDSLLKRCRNDIIVHLSVDNVIQTLVLADCHHDEKLKTRSLEFTYLHINEVFASAEWSVFVQNNSKLSSEVLQKLCTKLLSDRLS